MKYLFSYICDGLLNEVMDFLYSRLLSCHCLVAKLCLTLCDRMDYSLPVSSVHGISLQECCSGLPFPSAGDLPNPGIKLVSLGIGNWILYP